ncbi:MAG: hypothetical protein IH595_08870 [Bacteroidales bacterium]|nr:hypothetical protein [Bacteroidales bacterium]
MEHRTIRNLLLGSGMFIIWTLSSCYNDNYQTLYPSGPCDTTGVTFSATVKPILSTNCTGCHNSNFPSGSIALDTYSSVVSAVKGGRFLGSIQQAPGYIPMPQGAGKLSDCDISRIEAWINKGMPNN